LVKHLLGQKLKNLDFDYKIQICKAI